MGRYDERQTRIGEKGSRHVGEPQKASAQLLRMPKLNSIPCGADAGI